MKTVKMKVSDLVEDFDLYPRAQVDQTHVRHIADAIEAGIELPPIIACSKSKRIVDGFHRKRGYTLIYGKDHMVDVVLKDYKNDGDLFLEAMSLNANHGKNMSPFDRTHAIQKAFKFELDPELVASALNMRIDKVTEFKVERCARLENSRRVVPIKMPIRHMAGKVMTKEQVDAIPKLGGNQQVFLINQLITLIETGLFDWSNERAVVKLFHLGSLISRQEEKQAA